MEWKPALVLLLLLVTALSQANLLWKYEGNDGRLSDFLIQKWKAGPAQHSGKFEERVPGDFESNPGLHVLSMLRNCLLHRCRSVFFFSAVNASSHILPRIGLTLKTDDGLNTDLGVPTMTDALLTSLSRYAGLYYFKRSIVSLHLMLKAPLI